MTLCGQGFPEPASWAGGRLGANGGQEGWGAEKGIQLPSAPSPAAAASATTEPSLDYSM